MKRIINVFCILGLMVLWPLALQSQESKWVTWEERQRIAEMEKEKSAASNRPTVQAPRAPASAPTSTRVTRGAQPVTVRRPSSARLSSVSRAMPSTYKLERFQLQADLDAVIMYLEPMDMVVKVGEEFKTRIRLSNPRSRGFTRMFLALQYNPDVLLPLELDDAPLQANMLGPASAYVYESRGMLTYGAEFGTEVVLNDEKLLTVKWRSLAPARYSAITFASFNGRETSLSSKGEDILGESGVLGDGIIGATVRVLSSSPEDESEILTPMSIAEYTGPVTIGGAKLTLRSHTKKVRVGEIFLVDIDFENTHQALVDKIHVIVRFDPRVLQVVDYDEENWITRGVNIYDGPYHDAFPFDCHIKNSVSNTEGEIDYHMGISDSKLLTTRGTLATIVFRAIRPAESTPIFFFTPPRLHARGTTVSCMGVNVLGDLASDTDGVENLVVAIAK
jgi:hypothetical protein